MKKYSLTHIPIYSFFSKELYREVALHFRGFFLIYLFLLLSLVFIPLMYKFHLGINSFAKAQIFPIIEQLPEFRIINGKLSIDEIEPYYIKDPYTNKIMAIIDTSGKITSIKNTGAFLLLTDKELIIKEKEGETKIVSLPEDLDEDFVVNRNMARQLAQFLLKFASLGLYPIIVIGVFLAKIIQVLILALLGLFMSARQGLNLSYKTLFRLSIVALTPSIILKTVFDLLGISIPFGSFIWVMIPVGYLYFAINTTSEVDRTGDFN